jgi:hypothetical protein
MSKKVSPMDNHPQFEEKPGRLPSLHYAEIAERAEDVGCSPQVNDRFLVHLPRRGPKGGKLITGKF